MASDLSPEISILAVETNIFPLYEVEDGVRWTINHESRRFPVREYLLKQGRFAHLKESEIDHIQKETDDEWEKLRNRASRSASSAGHAPAIELSQG
jgi:pyruvate/2-oxoacid:ferredoxin oxidoreductase beta subunit